MTLLDIGGGFCGGNFDEDGNVDLGGVPTAVNSALEEYFSGEANANVRVIAEPGRSVSGATPVSAIITVIANANCLFVECGAMNCD